MMSGWRASSARTASAGGQDEQPWLVKSSTTARGRLGASRSGLQEGGEAEGAARAHQA